MCHPSSPLLPCVRTPGGEVVCGGGGRPCRRPFVARMSQARRKHGVRHLAAAGGGGCFLLWAFLPFSMVKAPHPRISSRCCPLAVVATSPHGAQCPVPAPSCAHTYWRRYVPGWKRMMRKCGQRGGLTVRLEGFLCHPPPWSRGGPLFRHPTARGGPTAHPLPGACVSTSERPDTGAVLSVRWKWRLQSGRALSSPGPLPPPSAMEAPEVLWHRRGETGGGFICGIPWPPSQSDQHNCCRRGPTGWRRWCPSPLRHNICNRRRGSSGWCHWRVSPLRHRLGHRTGGPTDGAAGACPPVPLPASGARLG